MPIVLLPMLHTCIGELYRVDALVLSFCSTHYEFKPEDM